MIQVHLVVFKQNFMYIKIRINQKKKLIKKTIKKLNCLMIRNIINIFNYFTKDNYDNN